MKNVRDEWMSKNEWKREKFRVYAKLEGWDKKGNVVTKKGKKVAVYSVLSSDTGKWWSVGNTLDPISDWGMTKVAANRH